MASELNYQLISKAEAHPEEVKRILEELQKETEAARSAYIEVAAAYRSSVQQEYDEQIQRLRAIRKELSERLQQLRQTEGLLVHGEAEGWPEVISTCQSRRDELRQRIGALYQLERESLEHRVEGDPDLFEDLTHKDQALEDQARRARLTRLAIGDVLDVKIEKLRVLFNQDPTEEAIERIEALRELQKIADNGLPQRAYVPPDLTFYLLNKRKGRPLKEWNRTRQGYLTDEEEHSEHEEQ